jgi:peptidoglycan hydrolase-like protein with peptidoglycan-binding domain
VKRFQRAAGLVPDGVVGPLTRAALVQRSEQVAAEVLRYGDRGPAVAELQRALGLPADGIFGKQTRRAVRQLQRDAGLTVDGIVGPATREALAQRDRAVDDDPEPVDGGGLEAAGEGVDARLAGALALAKRMGLELVSAHRPGATIAASGNRSDHAFLPSRAIDLAGSEDEMRRYARAVAGMAGVETVIYSPLGIWLAGRGWGEIRTSATYDEHLGHVHVDTFS